MGVGAVDIRGWGGAVQNRESPDFSSLEVGRYEYPVKGLNPGVISKVG